MTISGIETFLTELSVFGAFVKTPFSGIYRLDLFTTIALFLKSTSDHSSPASSPSLKPVNKSIMIATLYLICSSGNSFKFLKRILHCSSS